MVALIGIPFWFLERIGVALLSVIPLGVGHVFGVIFSVVLDIAQLVVCILIIIYGVQRAIEAATLKKPVDFGFVVKTSNGTTESKVKTETKVEPHVKVEPVEKAEVKVEVKSAPAVEPSVNVKIDEKTSVKKERVILPFIGNFFVLLFKGFVLVCMLPGFMMVLGLMIILGIMIALAIKGVYFIGLFMIVIGLLSFSSTILDIIYRTVFKRSAHHA
jgi:hypothetical protein